jgi:hypothetical protein
LQGRWEGEDEIMGTPPRLMSGAGLECVISMSGCGEGNHFLNQFLIHVRTETDVRN